MKPQFPVYFLMVSRNGPDSGSNQEGKPVPKTGDKGNPALWAGASCITLLPRQAGSMDSPVSAGLYHAAAVLHAVICRDDFRYFCSIGLYHSRSPGHNSKKQPKHISAETMH